MWMIIVEARGKEERRVERFDRIKEGTRPIWMERI